MICRTCKKEGVTLAAGRLHDVEIGEAFEERRNVATFDVAVTQLSLLVATYDHRNYIKVKLVAGLHTPCLGYQILQFGNSKSSPKW